MSTPTFNPTSESFDPVRLYTELDPYYYTIDNRPLQDIVSNTEGLGAASDAARRASLIESLGLSSVLTGLVGSGKVLSGLKIASSTANTVTVAPGAMLTPGGISEGDSRQVVRIGASPLPVVLNCPAPATLGREYTYIVQAKFNDFSGAVTYPNYDGANEFLPSTLLNGYLSVSIIVGAEANAGLSIPPTVTPGWDPLYVVVNATGATLPTVTVSPSSPARIAALAPEEPWIQPTLTNSWVNLAGYQPFQYRRVGNRVLIRGSISSGTAGSAAFTLPVGYRPPVNSGYIASNGTTGASFVSVNAAGTVIPSASATTHLGLIEFVLE